MSKSNEDKTKQDAERKEAVFIQVDTVESAKEIAKEPNRQN